MTDNNNTMGDFQFGLSSREAHADFVGSLYRELEPMREWGEIPEGITYWDVADCILDTISGYTTIDAVYATEIATLINDALVQIKDQDDQIS